MNIYHVNAGNAFSAPYESPYSVWRRCLVANPGTSLSLLEVRLRERDQWHRSAYARLKQLQLHKDYSPEFLNSSDLGYRRQCPKCASRLYHSNVFSYSWLRRCPGHKCRLTTECPRCQQSWPELKNIHRINCPVCGRPSIKCLAKHLRDKTMQQVWDEIAFIHQMVLGGNSQYRYIDNMHLDTRFNEDYYPWLQCQRHPMIDASRLKSLSIKMHPLKCQSSKLRPVLTSPVAADDSLETGYAGGFDDYPLTPTYAYKPCLSLVDHEGDVTYDTNIDPGFKRNVLQVFIVLRRILRWITKRKKHDNVVPIAHYRDLTAVSFIEKPEPCPFCLALSLWLYDAVADCYGSQVSDKVNDYAFCRTFRYENIHKHRNILQYHHDVKRSTDKRFSLWFYRRSLEVTYFDLLNFSLFFVETLQSYRDYDSDYMSIRPYSNPFEDVITGAVVDRFSSNLNYYYRDDFLLDKLDLSQWTDIKGACRRFHNENTYKDFERWAPHESLHIVCKVSYGMDLSGFVGIFETLSEHLVDWFNKRSRYGVDNNAETIQATLRCVNLHNELLKEPIGHEEEIGKANAGLTLTPLNRQDCFSRYIR